MSIRRELLDTAYNAGGGNKTIVARQQVATTLADFLMEKNIQIRKIGHLKAAHIEMFIQSRKDLGLDLRSLHNDMSGIRVILRKSGRNSLANSEKISNKSLGLAGASREGKHKAMPDDMFVKLCAALKEKDPDVYACALLERFLGLRGEEAIQANKSVESWLEELSRGDKVRVIYGTKGDKPRDVHIVDREKAIFAIEFAVQRVSENNGKIIDKPDLQSAMSRHAYIMRICGCVGDHSPHSLRYAFAGDRNDAYLDEGFSPNDSLAQTSMDLGHGDGRGRYIKHVYLKADVNETEATSAPHFCKAFLGKPLDLAPLSITAPLFPSSS